MAARLQVYRGKDGAYWWRHVAGNHRIDDASEQGYSYRWYAKFKAKRAYPGVKVETK